jgi:hypothetical protein
MHLVRIHPNRQVPSSKQHTAQDPDSDSDSTISFRKKAQPSEASTEPNLFTAHLGCYTTEYTDFAAVWSRGNDRKLQPARRRREDGVRACPGDPPSQQPTPLSEVFSGRKCTCATHSWDMYTTHFFAFPALLNPDGCALASVKLDLLLSNTGPNHSG